MEVIRLRLRELAIEVAEQLNVVDDDDERETLQVGFEQHLNDGLYAGSERRTARRRAGTW